MKITLSPSEDQTDESVRFYSITVESKYDSITTTEAVAMFFQAMLAWTYDEEQIQKAFNEFTQ